MLGTTPHGATSHTSVSPASAHTCVPAVAAPNKWQAYDEQSAAGDTLWKKEAEMCVSRGDKTNAVLRWIRTTADEDNVWHCRICHRLAVHKVFSCIIPDDARPEEARKIIDPLEGRWSILKKGMVEPGGYFCYPISTRRATAKQQHCERKDVQPSHDDYMRNPDYYEQDPVQWVAYEEATKLLGRAIELAKEGESSSAAGGESVNELLNQAEAEKEKMATHHENFMDTHPNSKSVLGMSMSKKHHDELADAMDAIRQGKLDTPMVDLFYKQEPTEEDLQFLPCDNNSLEHYGKYLDQAVHELSNVLGMERSSEADRVREHAKDILEAAYGYKHRALVEFAVAWHRQGKWHTPREEVLLEESEWAKEELKRAKVREDKLKAEREQADALHRERQEASEKRHREEMDAAIEEAREETRQDMYAELKKARDEKLQAIQEKQQAEKEAAEAREAQAAVTYKAEVAIRKAEAATRKASLNPSLQSNSLPSFVRKRPLPVGVREEVPDAGDKWPRDE